MIIVINHNFTKHSACLTNNLLIFNMVADTENSETLKGLPKFDGNLFDHTDSCAPAVKHTTLRIYVAVYCCAPFRMYTSQMSTVLSFMHPHPTMNVNLWKK